MTSVDVGRTTIDGIPDLDGFIETTRGDPFAVRGPGESIDDIGMTVIGIERVSLGGTAEGRPDLDGLIKAGRSDQFAIRGPGNACHRVGMTRIGKGRTACGGVPDLNSFVETAGSDAFAIGR